MLKLKGTFLKNILTVVTGTALAQLITIGVYPIIVRLYTPEDYGIMEAVVSITSILSTIISLKYEQAIVIPKSEREGYGLFKLSVLINLLLCSLITIFILFFSSMIANWLEKPDLRFYLFAIPLIVFFSGFFLSLKYYSIRQKKFNLLSRINVVKSLIGSSTQIIFGLLSWGSVGLIFSQLCSSIFSNFSFYKKLSGEAPFRTITKWKEEIPLYRFLIKKYSEFPKYSVVGTLANSALLYGTGIFIFKVFSAETLGYYAMANRLLALPLNLVTSSVSDVFVQRASEEKHQIGNAVESFKKVFFGLLVVAIPIGLLGYFFLPPVLEYILGNKWRLTGEYASILILLISIRLIVSPLSACFIVFNKQKLLLKFTVTQFVICTLLFFVSERLKYEFRNFLILFVIVQSAFYLLYLPVCWKIVRNK